MTGRRLSRRDVLGLGAVTAAAAAAGVLRAGAAAPDAPPGRLADVADRFVGLLSDPDGAAELGRAWLDGQARRPAVEDLVASISPATYPEAVLRAGDGDLRLLVASAVEDDYRADRVVAVRGWLLSVTEIRLCAICALT